jgi:hypothetical protein
MKTVKVRIALEIDPEGDWQASSSNIWGNDWEDGVSPWDEPGSKRYWIEAEVPVPEALHETISGKAVEAEPEAA